MQQNNNNGWNRSFSLTNSARLSSINTTTISSPSLPLLPLVSSSIPSLLQTRFYPTSSSFSFSNNSIPPSSVPTTASHLFQPYPTLSRSSSHLNYIGYNRVSSSNKSINRARLTTTLWEDENTICYQVDCRGICVARRQGLY